MNLTDLGKVRYELKTPFSNGTTHVFFSPLDFVSKFAALVLPASLNLTRFYGVSTLDSHVRADVTTPLRGKNSPWFAEHLKDSNNLYHARSMSLAQRYKRVFNIDITECEACEKINIKIIVRIKYPYVIYGIFGLFDKRTLLGAKAIL